MRGQRSLLGWLLALLLLAGCRSPEYYLRPPKPGEELVGVPPNDKRYTEPPNYPSDALKKLQSKNAAKNAGAGGMGPGMGGMGGGGMGGGGMGGGMSGVPNR